jgi:sporulation protein YlmC with PRC-barrel domain
MQSLYKFEDELRGAAIHATDDTLGSLQDLDFDDEDWVARYFVVDTSTWLPGRQVLISPASIERFSPSERAVYLNLTRNQIENSPSIDAAQPISREQETSLADYYGWPSYWSILTGRTHPALGKATAQVATETHLRSANDLVGYYLHASDGDLGHVYDLVIEEFTWTIRYLAIDTRNWWPGKKVLVAPAWIEEVDWAHVTVRVDLTRQAIRSSPEYHPEMPLERSYEQELWEHYGHRPYWTN